MTELTRAELAKELGFLPATAKGWTSTRQRCGRYNYRKRLAHLTNPDHLIVSVPPPTNASPLRMATRYVGRRKHV
jgi:hypothetical protein